MWHYHGVYGFKHPDPDYPFGIRPSDCPIGFRDNPRARRVTVPWIIVDRAGRRYMNEYPPYTQDTTWRPMADIRCQIDELSAHSVLHDHGRAWTWRLSDRVANLQ